MSTIPLSLAGEARASRPAVTPAGAPPAAETPAHRKLRKAAQEFESILISELLQNFHVTGSWGGETPEAGSDTLNSLAIQTMSTALAERGGLGIGRMLVHSLEPRLDRANTSPTGMGIKTRSSD
jgi:Rod binding domain-containing protein